ncbi:MAG: protein jag [Anaerolineae bacterium]|nr:protein jag [Anaerolineae bacterium]
MTEKTTLEVIAPTVEEAIAKGVEQLGVSREMVEVEVLDSGAAGFLGIGSRQARVRLMLNLVSYDQPLAPTPSANGALGDMSVSPAAQPEKVSAVAQPEKGESVLEVAQTVVRELLDKMGVKATVTTHLEKSLAPGEQDLILVEIQGNDLSILIGRRSETLNALQYISSLIVTKQVGHWVNLMIDVQGYRSRRERQLRRLAVKLAEQAISTGRRQVLEPMPANERRIIHLELSNHPQVTTESIGEEPNRKITIFVKK